MKALIVEDNKAHLLDIEMALIDLGIYNIIKATNVTEAIDLIKVAKPHIAFIDLLLGSESGYELIPILKSNDTYIVVVTGFPNTHNMQQSLSFNVDAFISKPVSQEEIQFQASKVKDKSGKVKAFHIFKYNNSLIKVDINDILYLEAEGNYTTIHTKNRKLVKKQSLKKVINEINSMEIVRIFRSTAINKNFITVVDFTSAKVSTSLDKEFILGRAFKKKLKKALELE